MLSLIARNLTQGVRLSFVVEIAFLPIKTTPEDRLLGLVVSAVARLQVVVKAATADSIK
jgi:hypothetical protein